MMGLELDFVTDIYEHLFIEEGSGKGWEWSATNTL